MCAPSDSAAVTAFGEALASDELYHALDLLRDIDGLADHVDVKPVLIDVSGKPLPPHNIMLEVAERDDPLVLIEEFLSKDWLGHVAAGYIVRWIVSRWNEPNAKRDASLTKAASSIEQWCTKFKIKGGKSQNVTKHLWPKYKSVAHLWAAHFVLIDAGIDPSTPEGCILFCSTADWILNQAADIVPNGRGPLDTFLCISEAWKIPASHVRPNTYVWSCEIGAHDIRNAGGPLIFEKPV